MGCVSRYNTRLAIGQHKTILMQYSFVYDVKKWSMLSVRMYVVLDARGKLGEYDASVRVGRGEAYYPL